jgi:hypothetical protein
MRERESCRDARARAFQRAARLARLARPGLDPTDPFTLAPPATPIRPRPARKGEHVPIAPGGSQSRFQKTIVFCVDTEHAFRMRRALLNENADLCREHER